MDNRLLNKLNKNFTFLNFADTLLNSCTMESKCKKKHVRKEII